MIGPAHFRCPARVDPPADELVASRDGVGRFVAGVAQAPVDGQQIRGADDGGRIGLGEEAPLEDLEARACGRTAWPVQLDGGVRERARCEVAGAVAAARTFVSVAWTS